MEQIYVANCRETDKGNKVHKDNRILFLVIKKNEVMWFAEK